MSWDEQFRRAAARIDDGSDWLEFPESLDKLSNQLAVEHGLGEAARAAMALVLVPIMRSTIRMIAEESPVDSPIEEAFLWALTGTALSRCMEVELTKGWVIGDGPERLVIEPQAKVRRYRVDFRLGFVSHMTNDGAPKSAEMFVECDGHDYHERTKAQAAKDRSRDRVLQTMGMPVFRFTGSEIFKDPLACARQVLDELDARAFGRKAAPE
jgi:very-short-patch-repair endonuclease